MTKTSVKRNSVWRKNGEDQRQEGEDQRQGGKMARNIFNVWARNNVWAERNNIRAAAGSCDAILRRDVAATLFYRNNVMAAASRSDAARNIFRAASGSTVGQVARQGTVGRAGNCSRVDRSPLLTLL